MEESSLQKKNAEEMHDVYFKRRLVLLVIATAVVIAALILLIGSGPGFEAPSDEGNEVTPLPPPVYEKPIIPPEPVVEDTSNETHEDCLMAPLDYLGCLRENEGDSIFEAYGMRLSDKNVRSIVRVVEDNCRTEPDPDRQCIVDTVFTKSENSWACEWECLEDMASCPSYKTHLAVAVLRQYVPPTEVFVGRTDDFDFFMIYKDNAGNWMQPQYIPLGANKKAETLYNDVYHAGPMDDIVFPEITQVEPGDNFCFQFYSNESCECKINVKSFAVGDCPMLPADMKGICDKPITEKVIIPGRNEICFTVNEDAKDALYTYEFSLNSDKEYWFAGNALINTRKYNCCVNETFKGFLEVND